MCSPPTTRSFDLMVGNAPIYATLNPPRAFSFMRAFFDNLRTENPERSKDEIISALKQKFGEEIIFHKEKPHTVDIFQY